MLVTVEPASTANVDAAPNATEDWLAFADEETLEDELVCELLDELLLVELRTELLELTLDDEDERDLLLLNREEEDCWLRRGIV
ncbi:MAG: hypothetical protein Q7S29_03370 [Candidatus Peribacter sp.]|nr:hypothetical protein [Candidatus Peribacter sp.]